MNRFRQALAKAKTDGHDMEHDPPANTLSRMNRFTCRKCGCAVLGNADTAYGSATESPCGASIRKACRECGPA